MSQVREVEGRHVRIMNFHSCPSIMVHTPANTHNAAAKRERRELCFGIPVWRARIEDDLIVVGMNGLFETQKKSICKKAFPISQKSSGMRNSRLNRCWTESQCLWWISCHCQPDSRWAAAPPNLHLLTSVFKQWRTIPGKGSRRGGRHHFSTSFRLHNADVCLSSDLCVHSKRRKTFETQVQTFYQSCDTKSFSNPPQRNHENVCQALVFSSSCECFAKLLRTNALEIHSM